MIHIDYLDLSTRTKNGLIRKGVLTINQLMLLDDEALLEIRQMGPKAKEEIRSKLNSYISSNPHLISEVTRPESTNLAASSAQQTLIQPCLIDIKEIDTTKDDAAIDMLHLSVRTENPLKRANILYIKQLAAKTTAELLNIEGIGLKALKEIQQALNSYVPEVSTPNRENNDDPRIHIFSRATSYNPSLPLTEISIVRLALPIKRLSYLHAQRVYTIGDLSRKATKLIDIDESDWQRVEDYLSWLGQHDERLWQSEIGNNSLNPFQQMFLRLDSIEQQMSDWLQVLVERQQEVIVKRYGLWGLQKTLEEIGESSKITRERVRQLQKKAERMLQTPYNSSLIQPLVWVIKQTVIKQGWVIKLTKLEREIERNYGVKLGRINLPGVVDLLCNITSGLETTKTRDIVVVLPYSLNDVLNIQEQIRSCLDSKIAPVPKHELFLEYEHQVYKHDQGIPVPEALLNACIHADSEIEILDSDIVTLSKWSNRRTDKIVMALRAIGEPAHFTTITERTNALLPENQQTTAHNVHAQIGRLPNIFVRVGHGIFGLAEWGLHNDGNLANAIVRVLEYAGQPLHIDAITSEVLKTWHVNSNSVYAAIQNDNRIIGMGGGKYYLNETVWVSDQTESSSVIGFGELFGDQLSKLQDEFDHRQKPDEFNISAEVDKIRDIGLGFFND